MVRDRKRRNGSRIDDYLYLVRSECCSRVINRICLSRAYFFSLILDWRQKEEKGVHSNKKIVLFPFTSANNEEYNIKGPQLVSQMMFSPCPLSSASLQSRWSTYLTLKRAMSIG